MKSPLEHACDLLRKADHDLITAQATLATEQASDMVCFHAQQAVEKSLKAMLASVAIARRRRNHPKPISFQ